MKNRSGKLVVTHQGEKFDDSSGVKHLIEKMETADLRKEDYKLEYVNEEGKATEIRI